MKNNNLNTAKQNTVNVRIGWIDTLKGIIIFLVVFGHFLTRLECGNYLNVIIYSFHMPLFFAVSGFNLKLNKEDFLKNNTKRIMLPYLKFCFLHICFLIILNICDGNIGSWAKGVFNVQNILHTVGMSHKSMFSGYWFLPVLWIAQILFFILNKRLKSSIKVFVLSIVCGIIYGIIVQGRNIVTPFGLGEAILALPFICVGYEIRKNIKKLNNKVWLMLTGSIFVVMHIYMKMKNVSIFNMYNSQVGNIVVFLLVGVVSCLVIMILASGIKWFDTKNIVAYCGKRSLWIFGFHYILMEIILKCHYTYIVEKNVLILRIYALIYSCIIVLLCVFIVNRKEKSRALQWR